MINMKMAVFWEVMPCSLVDIDQHIRGAYCRDHLDIIALMMGVVSTCEISMNIPEDSHT
jgi:hypothetical protein